MNTFREHLIKHSIKPSAQRLMIYECLYKNHNHPTVDNIYTSLLPDNPSLSKTTVYNTLKLFVENGIALVVNIDEHEARYDADTSVHGHFKCKNCGSLFDVHVPKPQANGLEGFSIENYQVYMKGLCKVCNIS